MENMENNDHLELDYYVHKCVLCGSRTYVNYTINVERGIVRTRWCVGCKKYFKTIEMGASFYRIDNGLRDIASHILGLNKEDMVALKALVDSIVRNDERTSKRNATGN